MNTAPKDPPAPVPDLQPLDFLIAINKARLAGFPKLAAAIERLFESYYPRK